MKLFRRHLVFLRPSIIVIYDELEADHAAEWTWLIHSPFEIKLDNNSRQFSLDNGKAKCRVDQFASLDIEIELGTEFDPKPVNFRQMKGPDGKILEFKDQWHIYSRPTQKSNKFRYLSVFQIKSNDDSSKFTEITPENGKIKLSDWEISAELDVSKEASFKIINQIKNKALIYNLPKLTLSGKTYQPKTLGSTLLIEATNEKIILEEAVDEFPKGKE